MNQWPTEANQKYRVVLKLDCVGPFFTTPILETRDSEGNIDVRRGGKRTVLSDKYIHTESNGALLCYLDKTYLWYTTTKPNKIQTICLSPGKITGGGHFNLHAVYFNAFLASG